MMIVVAIMSLITVLIVLNRGNFESSVVLNNLSYDVALAIRQAQVYATNVRPTSRVSTAGNLANTLGLFTAGYGIHFCMANSGVSPCNQSPGDASYSSFVMFEDLDNDRHYDGNSGGVNEFLRQYNIQNNNAIKSICIKKGASLFCDYNRTNFSGMPASDTLTPAIVDITFRRPDTEACINDSRTGLYDNPSGGVLVSMWCAGTSGTPTPPGYTLATIILANIKDPTKTRTIKISSAGQITVN